MCDWEGLERKAGQPYKNEGVSFPYGLCRGILRSRQRPARMVHPKAKSLERLSTSFLSCELRIVFMGVNCLLPYGLPWHESQPDSLALTKVLEQEQKDGGVPLEWMQSAQAAREPTFQGTASKLACREQRKALLRT